MNEHNHQKLVVLWFRATYPDLAAVFFAIPNGGRRDPATAKRLQEEGVLAGVPDLLLAVPRGPLAGLFLEMKAVLGGRLSQPQKAAHAALTAQGYAVAVAHGYEAAKAAIVDYLER
jgi:hypothetical protein